MLAWILATARVNPRCSAVLQVCPLLAAGYLIAAKLLIAPGFKAEEQEKEEA
ncbi:MAG: hypothetical protein ACLVLH_16455 [Eisenbergiella massiliensis]